MSPRPIDAARAALDRRRLYVVRIEPGSAPRRARPRRCSGSQLGRAADVEPSS